MLRVEEVAKHVKVTALFHCGDLNTGDGVDAVVPRFRVHFRDRGSRVVIRDGHHRKAGPGRAPDEFLGRAATVRSGRMEVQINAAQGGRRHRATRAAPEP